MASEGGGGGGGGTGAGSTGGSWSSKKRKLTIYEQYPSYTPNIPFALMERGPSRWFEPEAYNAAVSLREKLAAQAPLKAQSPGRTTPSVGDIIQEAYGNIDTALNSPTAQKLMELIALLRKLFGGEKAATSQAAPRPASVVPLPVTPPQLPPVSTDVPTIQNYPPPSGTGGGVSGGNGMALTLPFVGEGGGDWWEPLIDLGVGIGTQLLGGGNGGSSVVPGGSYFDIPGVDLQLPVVSESAKAATNCAVALTQGFHMTPSGQARPQPHVRCNPVTGKAQWFHPAKPSGFVMTHKTTRRRRHCCSGKR